MPGGQTASYITNIKEYADFVTLTSTNVPNTITGDFVQQGATNQVILRFNVRTDKSRAAFQSLTLTRFSVAETSRNEKCVCKLLTVVHQAPRRDK